MGSWFDKWLWTLAALVLVFNFAGCNGGRSNRPVSGRQAAPVINSITRTRRIYPYSLIPGGVESASELKTYSAVDPALADHYKTLGDGLALTKVNQDQWLYASYKISDAVYWTTKRILVHAGEGVLSNGTDMVRARCGNRLSPKAQVPVRMFEPPSVYTDRFIPEVVVLQPPSVIEPYAPPILPDFPTVSPPEQHETPPAIETAGRTGVPPAILTGGTKLPQGIYTPEPETWLLILGGLFGMAGVGYFQISPKRPSAFATAYIRLRRLTSR